LIEEAIDEWRITKTNSTLSNEIRRGRLRANSLLWRIHVSDGVCNTTLPDPANKENNSIERSSIESESL
jgi:hypothetical protein